MLFCSLDSISKLNYLYSVPTITLPVYSVPGSWSIVKNENLTHSSSCTCKLLNVLEILEFPKPIGIPPTTEYCPHFVVMLPTNSSEVQPYESMRLWLIKLSIIWLSLMHSGGYELIEEIQELQIGLPCYVLY